MKTIILLLTILSATSGIAQRTATAQNRPIVYGDLNLGYSNYGMAGEATLNLRQNDGLQHHLTFSSLSFMRGFALGKKGRTILSVGLSATRFDIHETEPVYNDFSIGSFLEVISENDYDEKFISSGTHIVPGVPVSFRRQFAADKKPGWVTGLKMDLNPEKVFVAATIGMRFGKASR